MIKQTFCGSLAHEVNFTERDWFGWEMGRGAECGDHGVHWHEKEKMHFTKSNLHPNPS